MILVAIIGGAILLGLFLYGLWRWANDPRPPASVEQARQEREERRRARDRERVLLGRDFPSWSTRWRQRAPYDYERRGF